MNSGNQSESVESQPQPTLCSNGCGFFANVTTGVMCSKCFRERQHAAEAAQKTADAVTLATRPAMLPAARQAQKEAREEAAVARMQEPVCASSPAVVVENPPASSSDASPPPPSGPCRCNVSTCRKKLGLTGFKCRCGYNYCGQHRAAETHSCTFDYKSFERMKIADCNPLVQASKIQKI